MRVALQPERATRHPTGSRERPRVDHLAGSDGFRGGELAKKPSVKLIEFGGVLCWVELGRFGGDLLPGLGHDVGRSQTDRGSH